MPEVGLQVFLKNGKTIMKAPIMESAVDFSISENEAFWKLSDNYN